MNRIRVIAVACAIGVVAVVGGVWLFGNRSASDSSKSVAAQSSPGSARSTAKNSALGVSTYNAPDEPGRVAIIDRAGRRVGTASKADLAANAIPPDTRSSVIDRSGVVKGYVLPGFGFVTAAVATDPVALRTLMGCVQAYALLEKQMASKITSAAGLPKGCRTVLKAQGGGLDPRLGE